jgi:hypothetical protein
MTPKPMLQAVLDELQTRKGQWRDIARQIDPETPDSYYSWLTKLAQGTIREPSVNKIQRLSDFFGLQRVGADETAVATPETLKRQAA